MVYSWTDRNKALDKYMAHPKKNWTLNDNFNQNRATIYPFYYKLSEGTEYF